MKHCEDAAAAAAKSPQSCPTLCDPTDAERRERCVGLLDASSCLAERRRGLAGGGDRGTWSGEGRPGVRLSHSGCPGAVLGSCKAGAWWAEAEAGVQAEEAPLGRLGEPYRE